MKAAVYYENGGPEVLRYEDVPDPVCGADEVMIRVEAISLEGGDLLHRQSSPPPARPHIVGYSTAGEIVALGAEVKGLERGQKVITFAWAGSHAELRTSKTAHTWALPPGLDARIGAGIPAAFGTAHECLIEAARVRADDTVLVLGASGGVGVAAVQIARRAGARVIGTAGSAAKLARLHALGMHEGIDYRRDDVGAAIARHTGERGYDVCIDTIGGRALQAASKAMAVNGRLIIAGCAAREPNLIDSVDIMVGRYSVTGVIAGFDFATPRLHAAIGELIAAIARGELAMPVAREFPLAEAAAAHAWVESGAAGFGRVLLIP